MRYYRLHCIDCRATEKVSPQTIYCEHDVEALGVMDAWDRARQEGYWPLHVIESGWTGARTWRPAPGTSGARRDIEH